MLFPPPFSINGLLFMLGALSFLAGFFIMFRALPIAYISNGWDEEEIRGMIRWSAGLLLFAIACFAGLIIRL